MTIIKIIIFGLVVVVGVTYFTLHRNGANLFQPPGVVERLQIFLTTNKAKTALNHKFYELQPPVFDMSSAQLYKKMIHVATELKWEVLSNDSQNETANFVARSPMFLFEDDIYVQVLFVDTNKSSLFVESYSRRGRADFAANSGHIQELFNRLQK